MTRNVAMQYFALFSGTVHLWHRKKGYLMMTESEVARLRQRIADEYLAAKYGLTGLASGVSKHEFITARMASMQ